MGELLARGAWRFVRWILAVAAVVAVGVLVASFLPESNFDRAVKAADKFRGALVDGRWQDACAMTTPAFRRRIEEKHGENCQRLARRTAGPGKPLHKVLACHSIREIVDSHQRNQHVEDSALFVYGVCDLRSGREAGQMGVHHEGGRWLITNLDAWTVNR